MSLRARRHTILLLLAALVASACGSGDGTDGAGGGATGTSGGAVQIWVPAAMGLGGFLRDEVGAASPGIDVTVDEVDARFDEWEAIVRSGVDADLVAVPIGLGNDLMAAGILGEPSTVLFDADVQADGVLVLSEVNLGVLLATPTPDGVGMPPLAMPTLVPVDWSDGCWIDPPMTATAHVAALAQGSADAQVVVTGGRTASDRAVEAGMDAALEFGVKQLILRLVAGSELEFYKRWGPGLLSRILLRTGSGEALASALGSQAAANAGLKAASSTVGRVNIVTTTALTMKDLYEYYKANYEADKARFDAMSSGIELFYDVMAQFGNQRLQAATLLTGLASCELSVQDARAELERLRTRILGLTNVAAEALVGVSEQWGAPSTDQMIEAWDNRQRLFDQTAAQVNAAIDAKEQSATDAAAAGDALKLADLVAEREAAAAATAEQLIDRESWETFANLLAGADQGNTWSHSDGQQTVVATGETDIVGHGSYWLDASPTSADMLFGEGGPFACGPGSMGVVVCGGDRPPGPGRLLVLTTILDAPVPTDGLDRYFQYGFVLDVDGNPGDNYQASTAYPADTYDGTDTWFQAVAEPGGTFELQFTDAANGFRFTATDARLKVYDNSMTLVIPGLDGKVVDGTWRATSFWHDGGYGVNGGPFNGDADPAVDQPQHRILDEVLTGNEVLLP